jgi:hypothetical protein
LSGVHFEKPLPTSSEEEGRQRLMSAIIHHFEFASKEGLEYYF